MIHAMAGVSHSEKSETAVIEINRNHRRRLGYRWGSRCRDIQHLSTQMIDMIRLKKITGDRNGGDARDDPIVRRPISAAHRVLRDVLQTRKINHDVAADAEGHQGQRAKPISDRPAMLDR